MLQVSDLHTQWRALPTGTLEEVAGLEHASCLRPIPMTRALDAAG
jgi:hypothetical protein